MLVQARRYIKTFLSLAKASFIEDLQYRFNLINELILDVAWYLGHITLFEVLYSHMPLIGSWNIAQTRMFLGFVFVADSIFSFLFMKNLNQMSEKVRKGELDLLLMKPINSQFFISFQRLNYGGILSLILASSWLIWSISQIKEIQLMFLPAALIVALCGVGIAYAWRFTLNAIAVIFVKSDNLEFIWYQIYRLGIRPDSILPNLVKSILSTIFPLLFIANIPTHIMTGKYGISMVLYALIITSILLWLTQKFWKYALTQYSSASS